MSEATEKAIAERYKRDHPKKKPATKKQESAPAPSKGE